MSKRDVPRRIEKVSLIEFDNEKVIGNMLPYASFDAVFIYDKSTEIIADEMLSFAGKMLDQKVKVLFSMGMCAEKIHDLFDDEICLLDRDDIDKTSETSETLTVYYDTVSVSTIEDVFLISRSSNIIFFIFGDSMTSKNTLCPLFDKESMISTIDKITLKIKAVLVHQL